MTSETHDVERVTPMDEGVQTHDQAQEAATYDVAAVQDKWQAGLGGPGPVPRRRRLRRGRSATR